VGAAGHQLGDGRQPARRRGGLGAGALADGGHHRGVGQLGIEHAFEL